MFYSGIGNINNSTRNKFISFFSSLNGQQIDVQADIIQGTDNTHSLGEGFEIITPKTCIRNKIIISFLTEWVFIARLYHRIRTLSSGSVIYLRYPPISKLTLFLAPLLYYSKLMGVCIVFEHNTKELPECRVINRNIGRRCIVRERLFGTTLRRLADGMVCVTQEICEYESSSGYHKETPRTVIGNGVCVESLPMRVAPKNPTSELHLLFSGHIQKWHGVDRFIRGMERSDLNIHLHIAGSGKELLYLQKLSVRYGLTDKITFYGYMTGQEYDTLFDLCHIAIGSLGIFRININQTSSLKVREYCARGIPFILGCEDPDFPVDFPYCFHVPNDETYLDMSAVWIFARRIFEDRAHPNKMREFAKNFLDWSVKKEQYMIFFSEIGGWGVSYIG